MYRVHPSCSRQNWFVSSFTFELLRSVYVSMELRWIINSWFFEANAFEIARPSFYLRKYIGCDKKWFLSIPRVVARTDLSLVFDSCSTHRLPRASKKLRWIIYSWFLRHSCLHQFVFADLLRICELRNLFNMFFSRSQAWLSPTWNEIPFVLKCSSTRTPSSISDVRLRPS